MRRLLLIFFTLVVGCAPQSQQSNLTAEQHRARIERHLVAPDYAKRVPKGHDSLADRLAYWHVPGVSVAVINDGKVDWAAAYGTADLESGKRVDERTLFHGASLSKPVNAIAVLKFAQEGKVDLDRDVNEQLKSWKVPPSELARGTPITLRRLLSHTAGMSVRFFGIGFPASQPAPTLLDVLNGKPPATQPVKIVDPPGKQYYYSGGAVAISQLMLEEAAKEPYPKIVKQQVFEPLSMTESTFELKLTPEQTARAAPGFKEGKRVNGPDRIYPAMSAAGLWTTARDYCQVVMEIQQAADGKGKILSPQAALAMLTPYIANAKSASPRKSTVGMGVFLAGRGKGRTFYHAGSHAGYACYMIGRLEAGQGVVVLTNGDDAFDLIAEIVQTVGKEYSWPEYQFVPPPRAKPTTKPATAPTTRLN
jgi:CubicO group peptidase (beta-lactamase class C family)